MVKTSLIPAAAALACGLSAGAAHAQNCSGPPITFNSEITELTGDLTVKSGQGCRFGLNGIEGAIQETVIVQKPRFGSAGVQGLNPYYMAKPGYKGPDEFAYSFIGTNQYGGPMRITIRRRVTVVP